MNEHARLLTSAVNTIYMNPKSPFFSKDEDLARARERARKIINTWPASKRALSIERATRGLRPFGSADQAFAYALLNAQGSYCCFIQECRVDFELDQQGAWTLNILASLKQSAARARRSVRPGGEL